MKSQESLSPPSDAPVILDTSPRSNPWPWLVSVGLLLVTVLLLWSQGRLWWCKCGQWFLWSGNIWSPHNSQHLFDPYSFSHILHGIIFYGLTVYLFPRMPLAWRLTLSLFIECFWELVENSSFIIQRYRETTISLDYYGDTLANTTADILLAAAGFQLARRLGLWGSVAFFVITELVLLMAIRDNLILNIIMLLYPIPAVKAWQAGG